MPCLHYQGPSVGLASSPNSTPMHWVCGKAVNWSPKPSPNEALKLGDLDIPIHVCLHYCHLGFAVGTGPHRKRGSRVLISLWKSPGILIRCHTMTETGHHNTARTTAKGSKTCGWHWPQHLHLPKSMGSRVTEVQCQLPNWCHHGLIDLGAPGIHTMVDVTGSLEAIWRLICQSSRTRTRRMPSLIKVGIGI